MKAPKNYLGIDVYAYYFDYGCYHITMHIANKWWLQGINPGSLKSKHMLSPHTASLGHIHL
jgi:hypothetical protein